ncbi:MAG: hypothetical protein IPL96_17920 [Holophagaceae bacterium]|nr:hypothetical protein [Holophagaceae bacterium]
MKGTSNAVNLVDGLDGLAAGGTPHRVPDLRRAGLRGGQHQDRELPRRPLRARRRGTVGLHRRHGGRIFGFLWFNAHQAEVFMGDTGSLALGGALGTVACMIKQELLLAIAGGLFVIEAISVILQIGSYKLRDGKRIFRMAPFHHHMELGGLAGDEGGHTPLDHGHLPVLALASLKLR